MKSTLDSKLISVNPGFTSVEPGFTSRSTSVRLCQINGCNSKYSARGLCRVHYRRNQNGTDLSTPIKRLELHGNSNSSEYRTRTSMLTRCYNPKNKDFKDYGGRGITVCDEWRNSFKAFLDDMGKRPPGKTLDRIDVNKGYYKENCRWATTSVQQINKRFAPNKSGYIGVYYHKSGWRAIFRQIHIGLYPTKLQASIAYQKARTEYLNRQLNV